MGEAEGRGGITSLRMRVIILSATTLAGAAWLIYKGPVPIVRGTTPLPEYTPFWYMLSAFPILGILLTDWMALFSFAGLNARAIELGLQIVALVCVSNLRLSFYIPLSGHSLLFAYVILRRAFVRFPAHRGRRIEDLAVVCLYALTAYVKIAWWDDLVTVVNATLLAAGLAGVSIYVSRGRG
jgi:hypothetical protein